MAKKKEPEQTNQTWRTPQWLYDHMEKKIVNRKFKIDVSASKKNAMCKKFYTIKDDGLAPETPWLSTNFCNPGFKHFGRWIERAIDEWHDHGKLSGMIGPKGCSQIWFHRYAKQGSIFAPDKRICFDHPNGKPSTSAREDSMVYIIGPGFKNNGKGFKMLPLAVR